MNKKFKAVVCAGAAKTKFDAVRRVSVHKCLVGDESLAYLYHEEMDNIFKGELGYLFAKDLISRGIETYLIQRKDSPFPELEGLAEPTKYFSTFDQLEASLAEVLPRVKPDLVFMTAAPPDYAATAIDGKMSSEQDEIQITYRKTPKLIDRIRTQAGPQCFIAGSKLLVGVSESVLQAAAVKQMQRADSDICIGNDLAKIDRVKKEHPFQVVFKDGSVQHISGLKSETSLKVIDLVLKQVEAKSC